MIIVKLTKSFPIRVCEWLLAGIMLSWSIALWNLTPADFHSPIYVGLERLLPQDTWAMLALGIAIMRLAALAINGGWRPSPHLRAAGAFLACFLWLQIGLGQFFAEQGNLGIAIYPWLFVADIYNVFRASHDARISDDRAHAAPDGRGVSGSADAAAY